jgi:hypothetical protein
VLANPAHVPLSSHEANIVPFRGKYFPIGSLEADPLEFGIMTRPIKFLIIRQPSAHLIVHGDMTVENRSWSTRFRGLVLIHAGLKTAINVPQLALEASEMRCGGIIGIAEIVDCVVSLGGPSPSSRAGAVRVLSAPRRNCSGV